MNHQERRKCRRLAEAALSNFDWALIWGLRDAAQRFLQDAVQWYDKALYDGPKYKRTVGTLAWLRFIDHDTKGAPVKAQIQPDEQDKPVALIYLRLEHNWLSAEDLERLESLRRYALDAGYRIGAAWPVKDPQDAEEEPRDFYLARRELKWGRVDVIVLWHEDLGEPDTLTREDLVLPPDPEETRLVWNPPACDPTLCKDAFHHCADCASHLTATGACPKCAA